MTRLYKRVCPTVGPYVTSFGRIYGLVSLHYFTIIPRNTRSGNGEGVGDEAPIESLLTKVVEGVNPVSVVKNGVPGKTSGVHSIANLDRNIDKKGFLTMDFKRRC